MLNRLKSFLSSKSRMVLNQGLFTGIIGVVLYVVDAIGSGFEMIKEFIYPEEGVTDIEAKEKLKSLLKIEAHGNFDMYQKQLELSNEIFRLKNSLHEEVRGQVFFESDEYIRYY